MWYTAEGDPTNNFIGLKIDRVKEIIALNKKGIIVESLDGFVEKTTAEKQPDYDNVVGQDSLTRFDKPKHNKNKGKWQGNKQNESGERRAEGGNKGQQPKKWQGNKPNESGEQKVQNKPQHKHHHKPNPNRNQQGQNKKWQGNKPNNPNQGNNNPK